jgi:hypothetical protein
MWDSRCKDSRTMQGAKYDHSPLMLSCSQGRRGYVIMGVGPDCVRRLAAPPGPEASAVDLRQGRLNLPFFK